MNIYRIPVHAQYSASYYFELEAPNQELAERAVEDAAGSILDSNTHVSMPTKPIRFSIQEDWLEYSRSGWAVLKLAECDDNGNDFDWELGRSICVGKAKEIERYHKQKRLDKLKAEIAKLESELENK